LHCGLLSFCSLFFSALTNQTLDWKENFRNNENITNLYHDRYKSVETKVDGGNMFNAHILNDDAEAEIACVSVFYSRTTY
jgi:hypothetical protein